MTWTAGESAGIVQFRDPIIGETGGGRRRNDGSFEAIPLLVVVVIVVLLVVVDVVAVVPRAHAVDERGQHRVGHQLFVKARAAAQRAGLHQDLDHFFIPFKSVESYLCNNQLILIIFKNNKKKKNKKKQRNPINGDKASSSKQKKNHGNFQKQLSINGIHKKKLN